MKISIIVAASENNVIGRNNDLPWYLPLDLKYFKDTTMGHCVVMGRKNFESIPPKYSPLVGRTNIVITRQKDYKANGAVVVNSIEDAIEYARRQSETECFITGGGEIFRQSLQYCDRIYLTRIHAVIEGDVYFPELNMNEWKEVSRDDRPADEKNNYSFSFLRFERIK
nr:Dihydrofolate reductase [uncultured bacterium]AIA17503.1 Dihydrofolate reductase [uncultured bacterium]AIA18166.1 Dihydrofolate reductase [uncultured bacterium]